MTTKLIRGEDTTTLRGYLRELAAEKQKADAAAAAQEAAQAAAQAVRQRAEHEVEQKRIAEGAKTIADARANRFAAIAARFAIPALA
ncbi:hypothetical protein AB4Y45_27955 [Paraburkholderia sp. EG287A]|uniref:hypothetical protein n=1 Tax=Paraburkholderia sp. EG287A TaxID=3237012 RepID=UPI0034D1D24E